MVTTVSITSVETGIVYKVPVTAEVAEALSSTTLAWHRGSGVLRACMRSSRRVIALPYDMTGTTIRSALQDLASFAS